MCFPKPNISSGFRQKFIAQIALVVFQNRNDFSQLGKKFSSLLFWDFGDQRGEFGSVYFENGRELLDRCFGGDLGGSLQDLFSLFDELGQGL